MKIAVLGGDGYLGWATAMFMSAKGHDTLAVDNYLRRQLTRQLDREPLIDVPELHERAEIWKAASGHAVEVRIGDLCDYPFTLSVMQEFQPDAVIHYAELPSAPYSMIDWETASKTINNNLNSTLNLVYAARDACPHTHLVKLGTMGEYGTPNIDIEEGYLEVDHNGRKETFLYPKTPGSVYHLSKVQDSDLMYLAARMWGLAITDLNQGPVYGIESPGSEADPRLAPLFNYDDIFGTVINRFIVQAVCGEPLTVYGQGGQRRGFLNIVDTLQCVDLALENPAKSGEFRVFNQFAELFSIKELSERVSKVGSAMGLDVVVRQIENPRKELEEHYYNPKNRFFRDLGFVPTELTDDILSGMIAYVLDHRSAICTDHLLPEVKW